MILYFMGSFMCRRKNTCGIECNIKNNADVLHYAAVADLRVRK